MTNSVAVVVLLYAWGTLCHPDLETPEATLHKIFHH